MSPGHLAQKFEGTRLVHHVNAVADAFCVSNLNRIAHVKLQVFGRNKPFHQFACVQRDVHVRILLVQIVEYAHVEGEILDGNVPVLRHDQVQADDVRIGRNEAGFGARHQEPGEDLREDHFFGFASCDLKQEALLDLATRIGFGRTAVEDLVARASAALICSAGGRQYLRQPILPAASVAYGRNRRSSRRDLASVSRSLPVGVSISS